MISRAALKVLSQAESRTALLSIEALWLGLESPSVRQLAPPQTASEPVLEPMQQAVERYQRELIQTALTQHAGKWAAAARELQMDPSNLRKLARRLTLI
ncbi:Nitric oxide reductase transcription regulator NorR2 [compost metagenome]